MAAHAKRFVPDAALRAANMCTQALGGMGLVSSYGLDRLSRVAQMPRIVDGTTEISRVVIGRALRGAGGICRTYRCREDIGSRNGEMERHYAWTACREG